MSHISYIVREDKICHILYYRSLLSREFNRKLDFAGWQGGSYKVKHSFSNIFIHDIPDHHCYLPVEILAEKVEILNK